MSNKCVSAHHLVPPTTLLAVLTLPTSSTHLFGNNTFICLHLDFLADATDGPEETNDVDDKVWEEVDRLPEAEVGDAGLGGEGGDEGGGLRGQGGEAGEGGGEQGGGLGVEGGEVRLLG